MSPLSCQRGTRTADNGRGDGVGEEESTVWCKREGGKVVVEWRGAAKRQLIIPTPKTSRAHTDSRILYTTFVCVLRLCHFALLIYETLQVP